MRKGRVHVAGHMHWAPEFGREFERTRSNWIVIGRTNSGLYASYEAVEEVGSGQDRARQRITQCVKGNEPGRLWREGYVRR